MPNFIDLPIRLDWVESLSLFALDYNQPEHIFVNCPVESIQVRALARSVIEEAHTTILHNNIDSLKSPQLREAIVNLWRTSANHKLGIGLTSCLERWIQYAWGDSMRDKDLHAYKTGMLAWRISHRKGNVKAIGSDGTLAELAVEYERLVILPTRLKNGIRDSVTTLVNTDSAEGNIFFNRALQWYEGEEPAEYIISVIHQGIGYLYFHDFWEVLQLNADSDSRRLLRNWIESYSKVELNFPLDRVLKYPSEMGPYLCQKDAGGIDSVWPSPCT